MEYTSIPLPKVIADLVREKAFKQGYRTVSEFVIDATRRRLDQI